jgi:hypothetical protein
VPFQPLAQNPSLPATLIAAAAMGSSYARSFTSLHLPRHPIAPSRNHHSTLPLRSRSGGHDWFRDTPFFGGSRLLLHAELIVAQRASKMSAVIRQRQEQAALLLSCQRHRAQLGDPPAQVVGSSYGGREGGTSASPTPMSSPAQPTLASCSSSAAPTSVLVSTWRPTTARSWRCSTPPRGTRWMRRQRR